MKFIYKRNKIYNITPKVSIYDENEKCIAVIHKKAFKAKEDFTAVSPENGATLFAIHAETIQDVAGLYSIYDANGSLVGSIKKEALKSAATWRSRAAILDTAQNKIGEVVERKAFDLKTNAEQVSTLLNGRTDIMVGEKCIGTISSNLGLQLKSLLKLQIAQTVTFEDTAYDALPEAVCLAIPGLLMILPPR